MKPESTPGEQNDREQAFLEVSRKKKYTDLYFE
jgi:hypothetical protein